MGLNLDRMIEVMHKCIKEGKSFAMAVTVPGCSECEVIVNAPQNLESKIAYYKGAYDFCGIHRANHEIRIVSYGTGIGYPEAVANIGRFE